MAAFYGAVLTAWSAAGIAGPQFLAWLRDNRPDGAAGAAFYCSAALLACALVVTLPPWLRRRG